MLLLITCIYLSINLAVQIELCNEHTLIARATCVCVSRRVFNPSCSDCLYTLPTVNFTGSVMLWLDKYRPSSLENLSYVPTLPSPSPPPTWV